MTDDRGEARPGLSALSQTIEGLEARLNEMMQARAAGAPARRSPPEFRESPPPFRETAPRERRPQLEPGNPRIDAELRDIARTLKDLRQSVREDFTASLRDELSGLHGMLSQIERQTDTRAIDDETRSELLRISEGVDWLLSNAAADDDSRLMAEFDHLQQLLRGLADAKSVSRLENKFDKLERQIAPFDPARLDLELTALARGLDDVRRVLEANETGQNLQEIEARMIDLAGAMEVLSTRMPAAGERLDGQMHAIERRIEDIDRNLERIGRRQTEATRDPAVERLEARLGDLSNAVAAVDWQMRDQSNKQSTLLENLDAVARRLESSDAADTHLRLEARIEKLASAVERLGADRHFLGEAMATLSDKVGDIDLKNVERRIAAKLESLGAAGLNDADRRDIRNQIAELSAVIENHEPRGIQEAINRINDKVSKIDIAGAERRISARLDTIGTAGLGENDRREIRDRFDKLSGLIESRDPRDIEAAVNQINDNIARIDLAGAERRIAARLDTIGTAGMSDADRREIRDQIGKLAALIEGRDTGAIEAAISQINDNIARIDLAGTERRIAARLDTIGTAGMSDADRREIRDQIGKLAALIEGRDTGAIEAAISQINDNIARIDLAGAERRIAARLDTIGTAGMSDADRREIRDQIGKLEALIEGRDTGAIEASVNRLNDNLAGLDLKGAEQRLGQKLEALSESGFGPEDRRALKGQLAGLSALIENRRGIEPEALEDAVTRINATVGNLDLSATERRLSAQIAAIPAPVADTELHSKLEASLAAEGRLAARLDALDVKGLEERLSLKIAAVEQNGAESRLSAQLSALATQLETSRRTENAPELQRLERQIAELTALMHRPEPKLPLGELESRIGARIDALSASNDDFIIEAAQHAAEAALKTFEADRKGETDEHIEVIRQLAADLKALNQPDGKKNDGFQTTLKTIAGHLNQMPLAAKAEAEPQAAPHSAHVGPPAFETRFSQSAQAPKDDSDEVMDILTRVRATRDDHRPLSHGPVLPVHERPHTEFRKREPQEPAGVRSQGLGPRTSRADLIAAARRAVTTAVADTEAVDEESEPARKGDGFSRRPVYLAAGAILLAIMAYPLLTDLGRDRETILAATQSLEAANLRRETPTVAPVAVANAAPAKSQGTIDLTIKPAAKASFAAEPEARPVSAFSMVETDDSIITGSIGKTAAGTERPRLADTSPKAAEKLKKAAEALENKAEDLVETASVTTKDVLELLNAPVKAPAPAITEAPKQPEDDSPVAAKPPEAPAAQASADMPEATQIAPETEAVAGTQAEPETMRPITAELPAGLETEALAEAARAGNPAALYEIGLRYLDGLGFKQDFSKAAFWFELSAERGSAPAAFQLGSLYEKGTGVDQDAAKAVSLYREAAEKGNVSAMHNLAVMSANGAAGGKPDFEAAGEWFKKAADRGVADSQFNLAILHARGAGVEADLTQSYKWFAVAAREGDADAEKRRDEVAEALSDADLKRAKALADDFKPLPLDETANRLSSPKDWMPDALVAKAAPLDKETVVRDIQAILNRNGYDAGPVDGELGAKTDAAIRAFQQANGFKADGAITPDLVKALLARNNA